VLRKGGSAGRSRKTGTVTSMTPDPEYLPEYKEASAEARRLLDRLVNQPAGFCDQAS